MNQCLPVPQVSWRMSQYLYSCGFPKERQRVAIHAKPSCPLASHCMLPKRTSPTQMRGDKDSKKRRRHSLTDPTGAGALLWTLHSIFRTETVA